MYAINKLYNCGIFQGAGKCKHYFEGWYFKNVDAEEKNILSIIPGISYENDYEQAHAFIQIIDGRTHRTYYIRYGIEEFKFSRNSFEIEIGDNSFSQEMISLNINREDISVCGKLSYTNIISWHSSMLSPNSMGWYAFIPVMECYHGVISLHHNISGSLIINHKELSFDNGLGYIEKDWGTSFPNSWIWLQSNHFDAGNTSFMLSIAKIPWHSRSFTGFIVGLWNNNKLYRLTTYTGAKLKHLKYCSNDLEISFFDKSFELIVKAHQGNTGELQSPVKGAMVGKVQESINGKLEVLLIDNKTGRTILNTKAHCCGMEVAGKIQELVSLP